MKNNLQKLNRSQNAEMTLGASGCGQCMGPVGVVTGSSECDQWVGPVGVVTGCGQCVVDILFTYLIMKYFYSSYVYAF